MEDYLFTSSSCGARPSSSGMRQQQQSDSAEVEFLRREVLDLERVIKSLHTSRTDDRYALERAEERASLVADESQQWRSLNEARFQETQTALRSVRAEHAAAIAAAAAREAETMMLTVELRLLCVELSEAETEREAARESEASALSIARSYRSFAAQGAGRLEEMRTGIESVQQRLQQRLSGFEHSARHALRVRGLRSVIGWRGARALYHALSRWMLLVFTAEQREAVQARLEAAYRYRDREQAQLRVQQSQERQRERESAEARAQQVEADATEARKERDRALAAAQQAAAKQAAADKEAAEARQQLASAERQAEAARQAAAADLAAARDQLAAARRDVLAAGAPAIAARESAESASAELAQCRAQLREASEEASTARAELAAERDAREEEARTRMFLERVLKDERAHAQRRADEAEVLAEVAEDHEALRRALQVVSDEASSVSFELSATLLNKALQR